MRCVHIYATPGVYNVTASCTSKFPRFTFEFSKQLISINSVFPQLDVENFRYCFQSCTGITTIPQGLFDNNTSVTNFGSCFYNCGLTNIPTGLFDKNINTTSFDGCFRNCNKLQINPFIFNLTQDRVNRFAGKSIKIDRCFAISSFAGIQGTAPDLWSYTYGSVTSGSVFDRQTAESLTNFADIPTGWK